jgi:arylsulfatase
VIKPGTMINDFFTHEDFLPTLAAAAGNTTVVDDCLKNCELGSESYYAHLDGYDLMPYFKGETKESARKEFLYWSDDGDLFALRYQNWKVAFIEQYHEGFEIWSKEYTYLRVPMIYNLRSDPFERGPQSFLYTDWMFHRVYVLVPAQALVGQWLQTFKDYPPMRPQRIGDMNAQWTRRRNSDLIGDFLRLLVDRVPGVVWVVLGHGRCNGLRVGA